MAISLATATHAMLDIKLIIRAPPQIQCSFLNTIQPPWRMSNKFLLSKILGFYFLILTGLSMHNSLITFSLNRILSALFKVWSRNLIPTTLYFF